MTRILLVALAAALLLYVTPATAPVELAGAALAPRVVERAVAHRGGGFSVRIGDGIFRLHIRGCDQCAASVTIEIRLPFFNSDVPTPHSQDSRRWQWGAGGRKLGVDG